MSNPVDSRAGAEPSLLSVRNLVAGFESVSGPSRVVDGVSFDVQRGSALAILGDSGCGKSLLGLSILQLLPKGGRVQSGEVLFDGRNLLSLAESEMRAVRGSQIAMIFQEATGALSPVHTIGWQLTTALRASGQLEPKHAARGSSTTPSSRVRELVEMVELPDPESVLDAYPHQLSAGMKQRALIAMALACNPRLLIADEPTSSLDAPIQAQVLDLLRRLIREEQRSMVLITHDLGVVAEIATDVLVMYKGKVVEAAPMPTLLSAPQHPYTRALLASIPRLRRNDKTAPTRGANWSPPKLSVLPDADESADETGKGCCFAARCPARRAAPEQFPRCLIDAPGLDPPLAKHRARCFYPQLDTLRNA